MQHHLRITLINSSTQEEVLNHFGETLHTDMNNKGQLTNVIAFIKMIRTMFVGITLKEAKEFTDEFKFFITKEFSLMDHEETVKARIKHMMDSLNLEELRNLEKISSFLVNETPHREDFNKFLEDK